MSELPEHLGGSLNKTHVDGGVLRYFRNELGCRSMLDVGCGPGGQVALAEELGYDALGVEGDWTLDFQTDNVLMHDFTEGAPEIDREFDLVWSVEFVEHVEAEYIPAYMPCFRTGKYVVMTHAPPGTEDAPHHVNCQWSDYWIDVFKQYGFRHDEELTKKIHELSTMKKPFIKRNGMVFVNTSREEGQKITVDMGFVKEQL